jgi:DNA-binding NarL/FixJ family response regulator
MIANKRAKEPKIRVLILDDHSIVREGVRMILENDDQLDLIGESANVADMLRLVEQDGPDVVLLDIGLAEGNSLFAITRILEICPEARILIFTGVVDADLHQKALLGGAHGVLLKERAGSVLITAIKKIYDGEAWIDRHLTAKVLHEAAHNGKIRSAIARKFDTLTDREREIVRLVAEGHHNNHIADTINVSEKTVRNRLTIIYSKLEVTSRLELALLTSQEGIDLS